VTLSFFWRTKWNGILEQGLELQSALEQLALFGF
jgi:hypothetical protein